MADLIIGGVAHPNMIPDDEEYTYCGDIAGAAASYAQVAQELAGDPISPPEAYTERPKQAFRWPHEYWQPTETAQGNLLIAKALIEAEIERLVRSEED